MAFPRQTVLCRRRHRIQCCRGERGRPYDGETFLERDAGTRFGGGPWCGKRRRAKSGLRHDKGSVYRALAIFHIGTFFKQLGANASIFTRLFINRAVSNSNALLLTDPPLRCTKPCTIPTVLRSPAVYVSVSAFFSRARASCTW